MARGGRQKASSSSSKTTSAAATAPLPLPRPAAPTSALLRPPTDPLMALKGRVAVPVADWDETRICQDVPHMTNVILESVMALTKNDPSTIDECLQLLSDFLRVGDVSCFPFSPLVTL